MLPQIAENLKVRPLWMSGTVCRGHRNNNLAPRGPGVSAEDHQANMSLRSSNLQRAIYGRCGFKNFSLARPIQRHTHKQRQPNPLENPFSPGFTTLSIAFAISRRCCHSSTQSFPCYVDWPCLQIFQEVNDVHG